VSICNAAREADGAAKIMIATKIAAKKKPR